MWLPYIYEGLSIRDKGLRLMDLYLVRVEAALGKMCPKQFVKSTIFTSYTWFSLEPTGQLWKNQFHICLAQNIKFIYPIGCQMLK